MLYNKKGDTMHKFTKQLDTYQHKYLVFKILLLVLDNKEFENLFKHLDYLFSNSYQLLNQNENSSNVYNIIDNNLFEIENIIEEVELNINDLVKLDLFVFLNGKKENYLFKFYQQLVSIVDESKSIKNALESIKPFQKNILKRYVDSLFNYLHNTNQINLINIDRINQILNQSVISLNDWSSINKISDTLIKSLDIQNKDFLDEKFRFELVLFLLNTEE